ncbi:hypothetical protein ES319_A01G151200v1 [Gossypium barbadense]|uniref:Uncharacterized protein n=2 Tax=Gossypium TaxID=3633 RepID=A0A5J5WYQ8_GOSBA|nr:hypothetical protein ES319_A01G151200v1 [Gossypium barbadense]TYH31308.1 hypothetical protein ES288_A01G163600v1 [Gossypium darwinii]
MPSRPKLQHRRSTSNSLRSCSLLFVESEILGTAIAFLHFQSKARSGFIIEGDGTKIHVCRVVGVRKQRRPKHALGVIKIKGRVVWELSKNLP